MNPGRGGNRGGTSGGRNSGWRWRSQGPAQQWVARGSLAAGAASSTPGSGSSNIRRHSGTSSIHDVTHKLNDQLMSEHPQEPNSEATCVRNTPPNATNSAKSVYRPQELSLSQPVIAPGCDDDYSPLSTTSPMVQSCIEKEKICKGEDSGVQAGQSPEDPRTNAECGSAHSQDKGVSFDICEKNKMPGKLKPSLFVTNKAMRHERKRHMQGENIMDIRPGMILLKGYLSLVDQIKLIKSCSDLGKGPGGFYVPGYRDGATLHLKMMCLGKHWDPERGKYFDERPNDETKPPPIPVEFLQLVEKAIKECHGYLESQTKEKNARRILPSMSPNICIINFYSRSGMLGLHQDKDESSESLREGLPVVSFSLGDTAEFRFGDEKDIDKSQKVDLESGDVLIFGGKSRHVFHGVKSIKPGTAPEDLVKETNLKPGRLNLTFRKY